MKMKFFFAKPSQCDEPGIYLCTENTAKRIIPLPKSAEPQLIEFPEQTIVIAKDQPQYRPLPAHRVPRDPQGRIICCWKLSWFDRLRILFGGVIWHQILTFNEPLQPQLIGLDKPAMQKP